MTAASALTLARLVAIDGGLYACVRRASSLPIWDVVLETGAVVPVRAVPDPAGGPLLVLRLVDHTLAALRQRALAESSS